MSSPGARGRWSDGETWALIEAWGPMYLGRNGGSLRGAEWRKVCSAVNGHRAAAGRRFNRSLVQCQKRMYTLRDQYKKEVAKHAPSGWRHFAQLRAILGDLDVGPPPGFAAKMPHPSCVKEEEVEMEEEEEEEEEASGGIASVSVGRRTVPDILLDRSGGPPPGFRAKMPAAATVKKGKEEVVKEEVGWTGPANGAASPPCCPAKVVTKLAEVATKLAEVYERVEMERLGVEKGKMEMEWGKRAAKTEAENLGETDDN